MLFRSESVPDFSFRNVRNKGMESDDEDVYTTDNESVSAKPGSGDHASYGKGFASMLGGDQGDDEDEYREDEELAPSSDPRVQKNRPFDEASVEHAFHQGETPGNAQVQYDDDGDDEDAPIRNGIKSMRRERRKDQRIARQTR